MVKKYLNIKTFKILLFYVSLLVLIFAIGTKQSFIDHDLFSRLIQGSSVFKTGGVFYNDPVSYTPTHTWFDPEWITSGFFYFISQKFGGVGLITLKCLFGFLIIFTMSLAIGQRLKTLNLKESPYNIPFYILILLIFTFVCALQHTVRCQSISFILLPVWILLLEKIRNGEDKFLYALPFVMLLWLNCHGGSIAGVGILILYAAGEFLNKKPYKKYLIALIFVCLVYFINPWGADFIKFIIESSYLDRSWIMEWQPTYRNMGDLHKFIPYFILLFLSIFSYITSSVIKKINYAKLDKTKLLVFIMVMFLSLNTRKHTELFAVVAPIFVYEDIYFVYNAITSKIKQMFKLDDEIIEPLSIIKNIIIYISIYIYSLVIFHTISYDVSYYGNIPNNFPIRAVEFMKMNDIKGNLLSQFHYAPYIGWKLYPNVKIYMDGRQEQVYDKKIFDELMQFYLHLIDNPYGILEENHADILMTDADWGDNHHFRDSEDWAEIYNDELVCIFIRKDKLQKEYLYPERYNYEIVDELFESDGF